MAKLGASFDPTQHDTEQRDFEPLPEGIYELELESSKESDKNSNDYFRLDVVYGVRLPEEYEGRKLFDGFNLVHSNTQAQEIANRQFASLCRAIGHAGSVDDSEDLHLRPFRAKVGMGKPSKDGKYPAKAEIKRFFFPDEGNLPDPAVSAPAANDNTRPAVNDNKPAPAAAVASAGNRPWGKK